MVTAVMETTVETTKNINVWVRPLSQGCRVRVESVANAFWILDRLIAMNSLAGLLRVELITSEFECTFDVPHSSRRTRASLESALTQIPRVQLMVEAEEI